jgi:hypothetical protein
MRFLILLAFLQVAVFAAAEETSGNLLQNGSFEKYTANWKIWWAKGSSKGSRMGKNQEFKVDGEYSLMVHLAEPDTRWCVMQTVPVKGGHEYEFSFYCFTENSFPGNAGSRVQFSDASGRHLGYAAQRRIPPTGNIWVDYRSTITVPENCATMTISLESYGPGQMFYDAVSVREITGAAANAIAYPDNTPILFPAGKSIVNSTPFPYWTYSNNALHFLQTSRILGTEYGLESEFAEIKEHNLSTFFGDGKVSKMFYPPTNLSVDKKLQASSDTVRNRLNHNDPAMIAATLKMIESTRHRPNELYFITDEWFANLTHIPKERPFKSDFWKNMDEIVKNSYGFGRYGIPENDEDNDPFKLIAFLRYQAALSTETVKKYYDAYKKVNPQGLVVGCDEWSAVTPLDWEKMGESCDLQPGQALHTLGGTAQFASALMSKFYADLTRKPVYPYLQIVAYPTAPEKATLKQWVDQSLQCGADGIFVGAVEWFDRFFNHPKFAAPENWQLYLELMDNIRRTTAFERPKDQVMALHFGSYSMMARRRSTVNYIAPMFGILGPRARSWFTITDDFGIDRDIKRWDDYRVVCINDSKYISETMQKALSRVVERGGILLVTDPEAFSYRIDGENLSAFREQLFGVKIAPERKPQVKINIGEKILENPNALSAQLQISNPENTRAVASFTDGSPAIVENRIGKGKVWYFAFNPGSNFSVDNSDWINQWREWLVELGAKIDYPIWRTVLPTPEIPPVPERQYTFWTGNGLLMVRNSPDTSMNPDPVNGTYSYLQPPQQIADTAETRIPFNQGKLTNRRSFADIKITRNARGGSSRDKEALEEKNWVVEFGENECSANHMVFDLEAEKPIQLFRLLFSGLLPATTLSISKDGEHWKQIDQQEKFEAEKQNRFQYYKINATARYLKLEFAARRPGSTLMLIEVDIAGK